MTQNADYGRVAQLRHWRASNGKEGDRLYLWCPGCDDFHAVEVTYAPQKWEWDGNLETPTIAPSIKVEYGAGGRVCHSYVKQGQWEFLGDCSHDLAGQTVPLPALPSWFMAGHNDSSGADS